MDLSVSYHDSFLQAEDIQLLSGPAWLNDNIIGFAMEYFEHAKFPNHQDVLFMGASVVQMVALIEQPTELQMLFGALNIASKKQIVLPLNDHLDPSSRGGSHWCLLVYNDAKFEIFDSLGCSSDMLAKAQVIAHRLHAGFGCGVPDQHGNINVNVANCPTQTNGYDCGVYAIAIAQHLASNNFSKAELFSQITPQHITDVRAELLSTLKGLSTT